MSHTSLELDNWKKVDIKGTFQFTYNNKSRYVGLDIPAIEFYFYLNTKFGKPDVNYDSVAGFFPERKFSLENEWCFVFQEYGNTIIVCGDDKINICVLSIEEAPNKLDFDLFCQRVQILLQSFSMEAFKDKSFSIYINYGFMLNHFITDLKKVQAKKIPASPELLSIPHEDMVSNKPEIQYRYIENANDYNHWLNFVLEKAANSLKIQILLPIYFESLIDLAFRVKLKKSLFNKSKIYGSKKKEVDIFEYFERLVLVQKLEAIAENCVQVDENRLKSFIESVLNDKESGDKRKKERNQLLHGNALFLQNTNINYYLDENYFIGFPDKARGIKAISDSIHSTTEDKKLLETIRIYEKRCNDFVDIFDDKGYFKFLVSSIAFGHNSETGGFIPLGVKNIEDLFAPTQWS